MAQNTGTWLFFFFFKLAKRDIILMGSRNGKQQRMFSDCMGILNHKLAVPASSAGGSLALSLLPGPGYLAGWGLLFPDPLVQTGRQEPLSLILANRS